MTNYIDEIQSSFTNDNNIKKWITTFSNTDKKSFSKTLLSRISVSQKHEDILKKNKEEYYHFLLVHWMNFISNISIKQFNYLKSKGIVDDDFLILQKQVKGFLDTKDFKEVALLLKNKKSSFSRLASRYGFPLSGQNNWQIISSHYFLDFKKKPDCFLSLNCKPYDLLKICRLFQKQCIVGKIPCHYQFDTTSSLIDNFIIWCDKENLSHYLDILNHLQERYPNLFSRCGEHSPVTASVLPYVGIGFPHDQTLEEYYSSRTNFIHDSIQDILWNYVSSHYNQKIFGQQTLIDYLAEQIISEYIKEINLSFLDPNKKYRDFHEKYHFFIRDINKKEFSQVMIPKVRKNLIKQFKMGHQNNTMTDIQLFYRFGWDRSHHTISKELICQTIEKNAKMIFQADSTLNQQLSSYLLLSINNYEVPNDYHSQIYPPKNKSLQKRK